MKLGECTGHTKRSKADEFKEKCRGKRDNLDEGRHIEGFPVGEDEDIYKLSDPPYYTAYPNPHIKEFIEKFGKPYDEKKDTYHREPFVGDVREGKNDPIYNAHPFHTKVPHKAIMKFIEHYSRPGDIVFDGFCGSGMTGIAGKIMGRHAILCDISPVTTFIAYNYNLPPNASLFEKHARSILKEVDAESGWMYRTWHPKSNALNRVDCQINYTVWSDVFNCPYCQQQIIFYDVAFDKASGRVMKRFHCPSCQAQVSKRELSRVTENIFDKTLGIELKMARQVPVIINYTVSGKRCEKMPDKDDLALIQSIEEAELPYWYPALRMPEGYNTRQPKVSHGFAYVHHFYTRRNLWVLASIWDKLRRSPDDLEPFLRFTFEQLILGMSKLARYVPTHYSQVNQFLSGTLYVASQVVEVTPRYILEGKISRLSSMLKKYFEFSKRVGHVLISTQSATDLSNIPVSSVDYIFTDPPFGGNLMYSELNFPYESWLKVFTNPEQEAIINATQQKGLPEYRALMLASFREMHRILKPNRWITVEFHNSRADVWNAIQESLAKAGFVIAQVAILDKKQGTFKQVTAAGAVKNDLIINAYKPKESFAKAFLEKAGYGLEGIFIEQHLEKLPIDQNIERAEQMLYSKMLAYYIQHGFEISMNAKQFYSMLRARFEERDGYWFLDNQADVYEERRKRVSLALEQATLFISDERSAIQWLNWFLSEPKGYDEIYPEFVQVLTTTADKIPELKELLEENFVSIDGKYRRPQALEKEEIKDRRNGRLLKEFEGYLEKTMNGKRLESVRKEAILAGFILCYQQKRFQDILTVSKRLPRPIVESSTEIFDLIDVAETKIGQKK